MTERKAKTIGLDQDTWRDLKLISLARDCTLSEAVRFLITAMKEQGEGNGVDGDDGTEKGSGKKGD